MSEEGVIEREVVVPAEPADVWGALVDAARLSTWFGAVPDRDLSLGEVVVFRWSDGSSRRAAVDVVERERLLVIRWLPFRSDSAGRVRPEPSTRVRFLLDREENGTRLTVSESRASGSGTQTIEAVSRLLARPAPQSPGLLEARGAP